MLMSDFEKLVVHEHFATPSACYDALSVRFGGEDAARLPSPRYLFCGEARYYPSTTPGTYRALIAEGTLGIKFARIDATGLFVEDYENSGGDAEIAECLAQHYLSTSDGLDFSVSLGVALAFALAERENEASRTAYIAVLDRELADSSSRFCLHDLRETGNAHRPVRPCGFVAVHHKGNFVDLKDAECRSELGLSWFSFTVEPSDVGSNRHASAPQLDALYDIRKDPWAATMIRHLDSLISAPSPQWGDDGLRHLIDARIALASRKLP